MRRFIKIATIALAILWMEGALSQTPRREKGAQKLDQPLKNLEDLSIDIRQRLMNAHRLKLIDLMECLERSMTSREFENIANATEAVIKRLTEVGETPGGLAGIARNPDIDGDGKITANEIAISKRAQDTLRADARHIVTWYANNLALARNDARSIVIQSASCLHPAYLAYLE